MGSGLMEGKVVIITGATSGIGRVTAKTLAGMGATMVVLGRDMHKGKQLMAEISGAMGRKDAEYILCDMASLDDVKKASMDFLSRYNRLDVLLANAGGINGRRKITNNGFEYTFGVNHLAHFVLTNLLLEKLKASAPARVVVTSSSAHALGHIEFDDLMSEHRYRALKAYSQSKLANVLFTFELSRRLEGTHVTVNCFHPGATRSNFVRNMGGLASVMAPIVGAFMQSSEKGARTQIHLASSSEVEGRTGEYFVRSKVEPPSKESNDIEVAKRLWVASEELTMPWLDR